jgi:hypothetical protein
VLSAGSITDAKLEGHTRATSNERVGPGTRVIAAANETAAGRVEREPPVDRLTARVTVES